MKFRTLYICTLLITIVLPNMSKAQKKYELKEITITAKKKVEEQAVTKTIVDSVQIAQSANSSLSELLSKSTPIFVKTYGQGSTATVSFRGTGASHTQVEWNGLNINNPMLGQVDFSQIPVWFIDNVELYHGGSSLQNSSGALGGSVSIGTKPHWSEKYHGTVVQGFGSFGKYQTMASVGGGSYKFQVKARYLYERANNNFEFINTSIPPFERTTQQNAEYDKHALTTDFYYNAGKQNFLSLNLWFHTSDRNLPTIMSYEGLGRKEYDKSDEIRIVAKWSKYWKDVNTVLSSGYSRTDMDYLLSNNTYLDWVINTDSRSYTNSFFNSYKVDWNISKKSVLKANINVDYHDVSTLNRLTQEGYQNDRLECGATASFHHSFNRFISGYVLIREELTDGEFSPIMPSIGVSSSPFKDKNFSIAINGTRNYHKPTLNDLYWQPGGNPDLRSEKGYTGDLSISYENVWANKFKLKTSASGYLSKIDDWIIWQPSEYMYWTAQNIQKVYARGVEANFELKYQLRAFEFTLNGNYVFTRTTNESDNLMANDSKGKQLIYIPLHKASTLFGTRYRNFYLDFMWNFTGERFTTSSNEYTRHKLPYYSLCDLTIGKKIYLGKIKKTAFDIQFKINNLFNVDYQAILWRAMPGRNYQFQIKFDF